MELTEREIELIDGMIEVQRDRANRCDTIANRAMAEKQKGWDLERVALLEKIKNTRATDTLLEKMAEALGDLSERCKRARAILRDGPEKGYWGILDTEKAEQAMQKYRERKDAK